MILACNYEEVVALTQGAKNVLEDPVVDRGRVAAPSAARAAVEALLPRLEGDLSVSTLADQQQLERAVDAIVKRLRHDMHGEVLATHPASEAAVAAYFDFAHAFAVLGRIRDLGSEMHAIIEIVTGAPPTDDTARTFRFPE